MKTVIVQEVITYSFEFPDGVLPFSENALAEGNPTTAEEWFCNLEDPWRRATSASVDNREIEVNTLRHV
jgi:hypothetical protein